MKQGRRSFGAGDGIRTRDIDLGKVALYQLSYSRFNPLILVGVRLAVNDSTGRECAR